MRFSEFLLAAPAVLALAAWQPCAVAQDAQDFVYTDEEGHLVLRFAGARPGSLDASQIEEIVNVHLSTMVHDRLRADSLFEAEPVDAQWASRLEPRIERHVTETAPEFTSITVECRSASCRLVLEHESTWSVSAHQALMETAQRVIRSFIEADSAGFKHVFLIAGHYQEPESPYTKVFMRRARDQGTKQGQPPGG